MNVFLVTSPFQYICAIEAKHHYKSHNNILMLVEQNKEPGISQQNSIVNYNEWDYIITIPRTSRTFYVPIAIRKIKKIANGNKFCTLFHAEYNAWRTKLLLRNIPFTKEVYFDDGTLTIQEYEEFIKPAIPYERPRLLNDLLLKAQGIKPIGRLEQSSHLEIFTIFNITGQTHKIVKNNFTILKNKYQDPCLFDKNAPIGFIGEGAIGHKGHKSISKYISEIKEFLLTTDKNILYFPHRTESKEVEILLKKIKNIIYHKSEFPLEIELIDKNIKLSSLIGVLSTAQYTASLLYKNMPIYTLITSKDELNKTIQRRYHRIEEVYRKQGIKNIQLPSIIDAE